MVKMNPTGLPELSKPSRDLLELREAKFIETKMFREIGKFNEYYILSVDPRFLPILGMFRGVLGDVWGYVGRL